jgi:hypothetical protein
MIDSSGHALIHATAAGDNHHWSVDVQLHAASEGTYALLFSTGEPVSPGWFSIAANDPALRCAAGHGRSCALADRGTDVVGVTTVGPGGTGVLRMTSDVGRGGWFQILRLEGGTASAVPFDIKIRSEALSNDETPYRFTIEQRSTATPSV